MAEHYFRPLKRGLYLAVNGKQALPEAKYFRGTNGDPGGWVASKDFASSKHIQGMHLDVNLFPHGKTPVVFEDAVNELVNGKQLTIEWLKEMNAKHRKRFYDGDDSEMTCGFEPLSVEKLVSWMNTFHPGWQKNQRPSNLNLINWTKGRLDTVQKRNQKKTFATDDGTKTWEQMVEFFKKKQPFSDLLTPERKPLSTQISEDKLDLLIALIKEKCPGPCPPLPYQPPINLKKKPLSTPPSKKEEQTTSNQPPPAPPPGGPKIRKPFLHGQRKRQRTDDNEGQTFNNNPPPDFPPNGSAIPIQRPFPPQPEPSINPFNQPPPDNPPSGSAIPIQRPFPPQPEPSINPFNQPPPNPPNGSAMIIEEAPEEPIITPSFQPPDNPPSGPTIPIQRPFPPQPEPSINPFNQPPPDNPPSGSAIPLYQQPFSPPEPILNPFSQEPGFPSPPAIKNVSIAQISNEITSEIQLKKYQEEIALFLQKIQDLEEKLQTADMELTREKNQKNVEIQQKDIAFKNLEEQLKTNQKLLQDELNLEKKNFEKEKKNFEKQVQNSLTQNSKLSYQQVQDLKTDFEKKLKDQQDAFEKKQKLQIDSLEKKNQYARDALVKQFETASKSKDENFQILNTQKGKIEENLATLKDNMKKIKDQNASEKEKLIQQMKDNNQKAIDLIVEENKRSVEIIQKTSQLSTFISSKMSVYFYNALTNKMDSYLSLRNIQSNPEYFLKWTNDKTMHLLLQLEQEVFEATHLNQEISEPTFFDTIANKILSDLNANQETVQLLNFLQVKGINWLDHLHYQFNILWVQWKENIFFNQLTAKVVSFQSGFANIQGQILESQVQDLGNALAISQNTIFQLREGILDVEDERDANSAMHRLLDIFFHFYNEGLTLPELTSNTKKLFNYLQNPQDQDTRELLENGFSSLLPLAVIGQLGQDHHIAKYLHPNLILVPIGNALFKKWQILTERPDLFKAQNENELSYFQDESFVKQAIGQFLVWNKVNILERYYSFLREQALQIISQFQSVQTQQKIFQLEQQFQQKQFQQSADIENLLRLSYTPFEEPVVQDVTDLPLLPEQSLPFETEEDVEFLQEEEPQSSSSGNPDWQAYNPPGAPPPGPPGWGPGAPLALPAPGPGAAPAQTKKYGMALREGKTKRPSSTSQKFRVF